MGCPCAGKKDFAAIGRYFAGMRQVGAPGMPRPVTVQATIGASLEAEVAGATTHASEVRVARGLPAEPKPHTLNRCVPFKPPSPGPWRATPAPASPACRYASHHHPKGRR